MSVERLRVVASASLDSHDQAIRAASNAVLASLCESMGEDLVLFLLGRVQDGLGNDAISDHAFELFVALTAAVKVEKHTADKPLLMSRGTPLSEAALQLCCQAAASRLAWRRRDVFEAAMGALHELLRAGSAVWEPGQHNRSFVLRHCVELLRSSRESASPQTPSPLAAAAPGGGLARGSCEEPPLSLV
eukprot:CAMPEP_0169481874 /NCGR_PEP_ID=MMETSP1042-20121227/30368_1 /TAXON_ID=464988 /ORGANISM="Hemiselmis andersenii, Strain CCMP1180" /LENGTH=188 /DNA_ID=CAMNT_0009596691 /DNA_START=44 /DNA_END=607 /DNA_ORIENTATION=-